MRGFILTILFCSSWCLALFSFILSFFAQHFSWRSRTPIFWWWRFSLWILLFRLYFLFVNYLCIPLSLFYLWNYSLFLIGTLSESILLLIRRRLRSFLISNTLASLVFTFRPSWLLRSFFRAALSFNYIGCLVFPRTILH
jgi:hypothetical protein